MLLYLMAGMPQHLQILYRQRNKREKRKPGIIPFKTPTHDLLFNTDFSVSCILSFSALLNQTSS